MKNDTVIFGGEKVGCYSGRCIFLRDPNIDMGRFGLDLTEGYIDDRPAFCFNLHLRALDSRDDLMTGTMYAFKCSREADKIEKIIKQVLKKEITPGVAYSLLTDMCLCEIFKKNPVTEMTLLIDKAFELGKRVGAEEKSQEIRTALGIE